MESEAKCQEWDVFETDGLCSVCGTSAAFRPIKPGHSLRETRCSVCGAARRTRDVARVLARLADGPETRLLPRALPALAGARIYEAQAKGPLHERLAPLPAYVCSEYIPETVAPGGVSPDGVRCEDLERLHFADAAFDYVITQDVLEHVADPWRAFDEIWRVLAPGGRHIFTVPVHVEGLEIVVVGFDFRAGDDGKPQFGEGLADIGRDGGHGVQGAGEGDEAGLGRIEVGQGSLAGGLGQGGQAAVVESGQGFLDGIGGLSGGTAAIGIEAGQLGHAYE